MEKSLDIEQILRRFAQAKKIDWNKAEIGRILGFGRAAVGNWITAGTLGTAWPGFISACEGMDIRWILFGVKQNEAPPADLESAITRIRSAGGTVSFPPG